MKNKKVLLNLLIVTLLLVNSILWYSNNTYIGTVFLFITLVFILISVIFIRKKHK